MCAHADSNAVPRPPIRHRRRDPSDIGGSGTESNMFRLKINNRLRIRLIFNTINPVAIRTGKKETVCTKEERTRHGRSKNRRNRLGQANYFVRRVMEERKYIFVFPERIKECPEDELHGCPCRCNDKCRIDQTSFPLSWNTREKNFLIDNAVGRRHS